MRLLVLAIIQSILLCGGQVFLKLALQSVGQVSFTWSFVSSQLTNWWWLACGVSFTTAGMFWMFIIKHWSFSQVYPLTGLSYVFGMVAGLLIFHEHVGWAQWVGVMLIIAGCGLVVN